MEKKAIRGREETLRSIYITKIYFWNTTVIKSIFRTWRLRAYHGLHSLQVHSEKEPSVAERPAAAAPQPIRGVEARGPPVA